MEGTNKLKLATHLLGASYPLAGLELLAEIKHSAKLSKTFPVGWLGRWLRKAENKATAQQCWGLGLAELGKIFPN